jgi:hypothetical protein
LEVKGFISLFNNRNIFILFKEIEWKIGLAL